MLIVCLLIASHYTTDIVIGNHKNSSPQEPEFDPETEQKLEIGGSLEFKKPIKKQEKKQSTIKRAYKNLRSKVAPLPWKEKVASRLLDCVIGVSTMITSIAFVVSFPHFIIAHVIALMFSISRIIKGCRYVRFIKVDKACGNAVLGLRSAFKVGAKEFWKTKNWKGFKTSLKI